MKYYHKHTKQSRSTFTNMVFKEMGHRGYAMWVLLLDAWYEKFDINDADTQAQIINKEGRVEFNFHSLQLSNNLRTKPKQLEVVLGLFQELNALTYTKDKDNFIISLCNYSEFLAPKYKTVYLSLTKGNPKGSLDKIRLDKIREEKNRIKKNGARAPTPPFNDFVSLWNKELGDKLPKVESLTSKRKAQLRLRFSEKPNMEYWECLFGKMKRTPFLLGDNDRNWKASFDWLLSNDTNHVKVFEDQYNNASIDSRASASAYVTEIGKRIGAI